MKHCPLTLIAQRENDPVYNKLFRESPYVPANRVTSFNLYQASCTICNKVSPYSGIDQLREWEKEHVEGVHPTYKLPQWLTKTEDN